MKTPTAVGHDAEPGGRATLWAEQQQERDLNGSLIVGHDHISAAVLAPL